MNSNPLLLASTAAFSLTALASADEGLQTSLTVDLNGEAEGDWMLIFPAGTSYARDGRGPFILENIEHMTMKSSLWSVWNWANHLNAETRPGDAIFYADILWISARRRGVESASDSDVFFSI